MRKGNILLVILVVIAVVASSVGGYYYWSSKPKNTFLPASTQDNEKRTPEEAKKISPISSPMLRQKNAEVTGSVFVYSMDEKTMTIQLIAQSKSGNIKDMAVWTDKNTNSQWVPFQTLIKLSVSDYVYAKFRDDQGNISDVYSDSIFPPNSPPPIKN